MVIQLYVEPGYYKDGGFGIRIENILLINKADTPNRFGDVDYLRFEHVTCVPIQTKLIEKSLLTPEEVEWVNRYNQFCYDQVAPQLEPDEIALAWLKRETLPI